MNIHIGTSGWNYPTGAGTWNGVFYPKPRPKGFDELAYYAQFFGTVEINSTFYGQPRPEITRTWADKTPSDFVFSAKLYQKFTHAQMFQERMEQTLTKKLGTAEIPDSVIVALIAANMADIDEFKRGLEPLATSGKLGPLLAQFPASFRDNTASRAHLAALLRAFGDYSVAVELRHKTWSDHQTNTLALLDAFGAGWVQIDEPKFQDSVQQDFTPTTAPFFYLRLHGRNANAWWKHAHKDERYHYDYSREELVPMANALKEAAHAHKRAYAYLNNHFNARAVINATVLEELANISRRRELPVALVRQPRSQ